MIDTVRDWDHITVGDHRYGGTEFRVGPRKIGHIHEWGMLDIAYLRKLRDALIDEGQTGIHHLLTESGWTTFYLESADDFDHAEWLLRLSYLYHINVLKKTPAGSEEFADVDVAVAVADMALSERVRAALERRWPHVGHARRYVPFVVVVGGFDRIDEMGIRR